MPLRRKKPTVRDTLENTYDELRSQVAEKAPVLRDQVAAKLGEGAEEVRHRLPELQAALVERLPDSAVERLPDSVKPAKKKKSRLKKIAIVGLLAAAGGFVYSKLKSATAGPAYTPPAGGTPDIAKPGPTPVPDEVDEIADGAAPDAVK